VKRASADDSTRATECENKSSLGHSNLLFVSFLIFVEKGGVKMEIFAAILVAMPIAFFAGVYVHHRAVETARVLQYMV